jgi:manganese-dependent inorganic pyrophosphatase
MFSVVDILQEKNTTIILNGDDTEVIEKVFLCTVQNNLADLGNRLSRKKQIIPQLTDYFNSLS